MIAAELLDRGIEPCGALYRGQDLRLRACGRPTGHGGQHFVLADRRCAACPELIGPGEAFVVLNDGQWFHADCYYAEALA